MGTYPGYRSPWFAPLTGLAVNKVVWHRRRRYGWGRSGKGGRCDGTHARPYAHGGYVAPGRAPPSKQGTEVPRRGVAAARVTRPFAIAKRGPRNGVATAAPRSPLPSKGQAPLERPHRGGTRGRVPVLFRRRPSALGEAGREASRRPHRRRRLPHPYLEPRTNNGVKKRKFFSLFCSRNRPGRPRWRPRTAPGGRASQRAMRSLIAQ